MQVEINCQTGEVIQRPLTVKEQARLDAWNAKQVEEKIKEQDKERKRGEDLSLVKEKAKKDADFAALARLLGVEV